MDWIQVFKTGKHIDASGQEKEWRKEDLDQIIYSYNPQGHEAPVVIGHPEENAPAYGWVEALKREGEVLYAKLKNLVPDFVDMVRRGLFKKRSISVYPDLTLRHIGFLGAIPPAIKGLEDIKFQERDQTTISFSDFQDNINFGEGGMEMSKSRKSDLGEAAGKKIMELVEAKMRNDKALSYGESLAKVQLENPQLIREYLIPDQIRIEDAHRRAMDILKDPSKAGKYAEGLRENLSYRQALEIVLRQDPELAGRYTEGLHLSGG